MSADEQRIQAIVSEIRKVTWGQIPQPTIDELATLRRKVHCDAAGVPIPDNHPISSAWYSTSRSLHQRKRRRWVAKKK